MKIKKLRLKNGYKRFHDLTIDLGESPKRIVALVGPNGCGKSSVLDGLLYRVNAYRQVGNTPVKGYTYHSMNNDPGFQWSNIEVDFDGGSYDEVYQHLGQTGKANTLVSFRSPYRYNSALNVQQTMAVPEIRLNDYGASVASDLDQKMEINYRRLQIKYENYMHETDCKPSEAKAHIIGVLNASIRNCLGLELHSLGNIAASQGTMYFKKPDHPREFEFNVLSSGEKEIIDLLLDLYLRKDEYDNTIFLFDEPELHINTAIQRKLLIEINRLVGPNCQIWLSTHSIGFLRALQDEFANDCQVIHFSQSMALASNPYTITPSVMTANKWREIFEIALDDLVELVSPHRIIYCEGRAEPGRNGNERGMDAIIYNSIFSAAYQNTLFVSSGGNTELDQRSSIALAIISKALPALEIYILKDRDISSGRLTSEQQRQIYLQNNDVSHRVLIRWEIENYLYDKEVLKVYCSENQLTLNETAYDQFVTNIVDQNLKDETGRIKNFCGLQVPINADIFKKNLGLCIRPGMDVYAELEKCIFNRA